MIHATQTTTQLLNDLRHRSNDAAWSEFDGRYRPILIALAERYGVRPSDSADVAQDVLAEFARAYAQGGYDRERGRLRMWLIGIARRRIADHLRQRARRPELSLSAEIVDLPEDAELEQVWDIEHRRSVFVAAFGMLRASMKMSPQTVRVFEMHVVEGQSVEATVAALGVTAHDVYQAKSRCLGRMRELCAEVERRFEGE